MIQPTDFMHPHDATALNHLKAIPGFPVLAKKVLEYGYEKLKYGLNMASTIRLSPTQLPHLYNRLPPICQRLGIPVPEFYLEMDPEPNAYTSGETRVFIVVTSALVEMMDEEELDAILAHECGHIVCHHVMYKMVADFITTGLDVAGLLGPLVKPVEYALLHWSRMAELSCDRCASVITSPEVVARTMARLSGGPKSITKHINMQEWAHQADQYELIKNDGLWNKALQLAVTLSKTHPFSAVRVREILNWGQSNQYRDLVNRKYMISMGNRCPSCNQTIDVNWKFCKYCGKKL